MRTLLFTGKGGVGKTTVAAATALAGARSGLRTLLMSTDPAHSLADVLDTPLADQPTAVTDGLDGQQIDAQARLEQHWAEVRDHLVALLDWAGLHRVEAEEMAVVPGLDEVFALSDVKAHHDSGRYDLLVVDCAPTAETLRLLALPDVLTRFMERAFPVDAVIVNRLLPAGLSDPYFARWKEVQAGHLAGVYEAFSPLPVFEVPLMADEPIGEEALLDLAAVCYEDSDPAAVLHDGLPARVVEEDGSLVLDLRLPFAARDDLDLGRRDGELFLRVGPYRRTFTLPASLERREVADARL